MCKNFKEGLTIRELMLFLQSFCESDHKLKFSNLKATIAQLVEQLTCISRSLVRSRLVAPCVKVHNKRIGRP